MTSSSIEESLVRFSFNIKGCTSRDKFEDIHCRFSKNSVRTIYRINFKAPRRTRNSDLSSTCASRLPPSRNWIIYAPKSFMRRKRESVIDLSHVSRIWEMCLFENPETRKKEPISSGSHSTGDPFVAVDRAADDRYQQAGYIVGCAREDIYESLSQSFTRFGNTRGKEKEKKREKERELPRVEESRPPCERLNRSSPPPPHLSRWSPACRRDGAGEDHSLPGPAGFRLPFLGQIVASELVVAYASERWSFWCW